MEYLAYYFPISRRKAIYIILLILILNFYTTILFGFVQIKIILKENHMLFGSAEAPISGELRERTFPLAFSILAHGDVDRLKRLLVAIYRPQNFYCIHVDRKADSKVWTQASRLLASLGPNVHLVKFDESIRVRWGTFSLLQAELVCARKALESGYEWKYYINLTGQEFPLRTNWELVRVLRIMNGSNLVQGQKVWKRKWAIPPRETYGNMSITWYEGSFHVALTRGLVDYMFTDPKPQLLLDAIRNHEHRLHHGTFADEQYFITLNNNPSIIPIPGAYLRGPERCIKQPFLTRYKIWRVKKDRCMSKYFRRLICIFGQKDVALMKQSPELFANKFLKSFEPQGYDELERWIQMKRQYEIENQNFHPSFNQSYYEKLEVRWNHL